MNRAEGLLLARKLKEVLLERGYPIQKVLLYGSVARGEAQSTSDIDIAVVTTAFKKSQTEEGAEILLTSKDVDLRIETVALHPEDFTHPFFTLAREIEKNGIEV